MPKKLRAIPVVDDSTGIAYFLPLDTVGLMAGSVKIAKLIGGPGVLLSLTKRIPEFAVKGAKGFKLDKFDAQIIDTL